jgi:hypothetical protein
MVGPFWRRSRPTGDVVRLMALYETSDELDARAEQLGSLLVGSVDEWRRQPSAILLRAALVMLRDSLEMLPAVMDKRARDYCRALEGEIGPRVLLASLAFRDLGRGSGNRPFAEAHAACQLLYFACKGRDKRAVERRVARLREAIGRLEEGGST